MVIGAGGAGKALAYGAKEKGAKVVIANRTYGNVHILHLVTFPFYKDSIKRSCLSLTLLFLFLAVCFEERAVELAEAIGGKALSLTDLDNFHPEDGMVLANTTSMGMQPNVDETPISKVTTLSFWFLSVTKEPFLNLLASSFSFVFSSMH